MFGGYIDEELEAGDVIDYSLQGIPKNIAIT